MNIKRFTGRTSSEALAQVRQELGDDAVVLSTKPGPNGVEVLALAPESMQQIEAAAAKTPKPSAAAAPAPAVAPAPSPAAAPAALATGLKARARSLADRIAARGERLEPTLDMPAPAEPALRAELAEPEAAPGAVDQDVKALGMSTLTFQDYVRERMMRRRQTELERQAAPAGDQLVAQLAARQAAQAPMAAMAGAATGGAAGASSLSAGLGAAVAAASAGPAAAARAAPAALAAATARRAALREPPVLREELSLADPTPPARVPVQHELPALKREPAHQAAALQLGDEDEATPLRRAPATVNRRDHDEMLGELRSVRSLIEERFGMLAFMDRLGKNPNQVALAQQLFDIGLSPGMVRKLTQALPDTAEDALAWAAAVLENNLITNEHEAPIEDHEGVLALIGPTGVGKTTTTAKIAAAFAARHGAANLGLITLDAYRVGAHEQLRAYGRILGVPVHTAHDRASLEDLLELLSGKRLVLIDTAGMAQRDSRTRELLEMLQNPLIHKLLVVNAAAQGETVEDVMVGYRVHTCHGVVVSKLDEAVKLGPALDALVRHTARVVGVANGQRVPEDWHRLSAQALVQRALHGGGTANWRFNANEVSLMFAATQGSTAPEPAGLHA